MAKNDYQAEIISDRALRKAQDGPKTDYKLTLGGSSNIVEVTGAPMRITVDTINLDADMARFLLTECNYDHQRPIRPDAVEMLKNEILNNRFWHSDMAMMTWKDKTAMTEGRHRSLAVVMADKERPGVTIPVTLSHLEARSEEDLARDYSHRDIGLGRTMHDMTRAYQLDKQLGLNGRELNILAAATKPIRANFGPSGFATRGAMRSRGETQEAIEDWGKEAGEFFKISSNKPTHIRRLFERQAVSSVALVTLRYQLDDAKEFWEGAMEDSGLLVGDPRKTLLDYLRRNSAHGHNRGSYCRAVMACWNAWKKGRDLKVVRIMATTPVHIEGTPFEAKNLEQ